MGSLGDFLNKKQDEKRNAEKAIQEKRDQFNIEFKRLHGLISEWFRDEITAAQIEVFEAPAISANLQPPLIIRSVLGDIELQSDTTLLQGRLGKVIIRYRHIEKVIYSRGARVWEHKGGREVTQESFTEVITGLLANR